MTALGGYVVGPVIPAAESPWPCNWEQNPRTDNGHEHRWESVLLEADGKHRVRVDEVIRCQICHAPRCDGRAMQNPCMERRHHHGKHRHLDGRKAPLGERLSPTAPRGTSRSARSTTTRPCTPRTSWRPWTRACRSRRARRSPGVTPSLSRRSGGSSRTGRPGSRT